MEGADLKVLKTKDVENPDGFEILLPFDFLIYFEDDPRETLGIQRHGNGVPGVDSLKKDTGESVCAGKRPRADSTQQITVHVSAYVYTCSMVSGEQISSPLSIMER